MFGRGLGHHPSLLARLWLLAARIRRGAIAGLQGDRISGLHDKRAEPRDVAVLDTGPRTEKADAAGDLAIVVEDRRGERDGADKDFAVADGIAPAARDL